MTISRFNRKKHQRAVIAGGGGGGIPDYGTPGDSFASDSSSILVGAATRTIGMSSNLNALSRPASSIVYAGQIGQPPKQVLFANDENISAGTVETASRSEPTNFTDIDVQSDGAAILGNTNALNPLYRATLTTAFDLTGATSVYTDVVPNIGTVFGLSALNVFGAYTNPAGTRFWTSTTTQMRMATMVTPFDYANMVDSGQAQTIGTTANNWSCCLTPDEKFVLVVDNSNDRLKIYELTTPGSLAAWTLRHDIDMNGTYGLVAPSGVAIDVWRKKIYIGDRQTDTVYQFSWT